MPKHGLLLAKHGSTSDQNKTAWLINGQFRQGLIISSRWWLNEIHATFDHFSAAALILECRSAWKNLRPKPSGLSHHFSIWPWPLLKEKCSLLLWLIHWSYPVFCWNLCPTVCVTWFLIIRSWPLWPEPTDCTMSLSDHSTWIKEEESSFHPVSTSSQ